METILLLPTKKKKKHQHTRLHKTTYYLQRTTSNRTKSVYNSFENKTESSTSK